MIRSLNYLINWRQKMKKIPYYYLADIVKVFLLGVRTDNKLDNGTKTPNIIARSYSKNDPRYFEYIVEWEDLFKLRKDIIRCLKKSEDNKIIKLANAIEDVHSKKYDIQQISSEEHSALEEFVKAQISMHPPKYRRRLALVRSQHTEGSTITITWKIKLDKPT